MMKRYEVVAGILKNKGKFFVGKEDEDFLKRCGNFLVEKLKKVKERNRH